MGGGLLGISKNHIFFLQNLTKNGNKVGTIYKAEMTLLFSSVLHNFFLLKIYRIVRFFGKIDWSMKTGPRWGGDS